MDSDKPDLKISSFSSPNTYVHNEDEIQVSNQ